MAERQLSDVVDIDESNVFDSGVSVQLSSNNRFRDIASLLFRNAISKAIIHAEDRDPADSDQVPGLSQYWINTDTNARFVSDAGADWEELSSTTLTGPQIVSLLAALTGDARLSYDSLKDKPTIPAELTGLGIVALLAALTDDDRFSYNSLKDKPTIPTIPDPLTGGDVVTLLAALTGNDRLAASAIRDLPDGNGLTSVATDDTLEGDGTAESPLSVADDPSGEIGKILSIGSYAFGSSSSPASGNAGWNSNTLHVHTTSSSGDASATLGGLKQGDYLYLGSEAILEITAAPTSASSIYTFTVTALQGTVPTSESHTIYYITEERALIAGAVHSFNIANGAVTLAKLAGEVLTNWLTAVATDATLTGDGTSGSPLSVVAPASDDSPPDIDISMYETFGSWAWTSTSVPATGQFYVESGELRIFETDSGSTDKRTALDDAAVGDRFQFGELNAFEVTAVGVRSGNGLWTFTGSWAEPFDVGDFDGSYSVRYIKKANVLVRNVAVADRYLKLNSSLLIDANDPRDNLETLWTGSISPDDADDLAATHNLDAGRKFSDYKVLFFRSRGRNRPTWNACPANEFAASTDVAEIDTRGIAATLGWVSDTSFRFTHSYGSDFQLQHIMGMKGA